MKPPKKHKDVSETNRFELHEADILIYLKDIEILFKEYNGNVLKEFEEKKNDVGYQHRHDWNPAKF